MIRAAALVVVAAGAGLSAWLWSRGHRNPREWPGDLAGEWAELRGDLRAANEVGMRAAARREEEIDRELGEAGRRPPG